MGKSFVRVSNIRTSATVAPIARFSETPLPCFFHPRHPEPSHWLSGPVALNPAAPAFAFLFLQKKQCLQKAYPPWDNLHQEYKLQYLVLQLGLQDQLDLNRKREQPHSVRHLLIEELTSFDQEWIAICR